ncbi:hypothetical protein HDA32_001432 [Spinactinospora alkalitolerans]|uniref:Uncharacterized protein n=1 Tax=Spinactinospora alkalitolerans TaxID=687207 RepID=A0A852TTX9_9ACTN|nr:hypothetical protein [Spinactinospora alkalitolerans]NYE46312.1 hypothetical protein [Spinactinospora alkalitolerans]
MSQSSPSKAGPLRKDVMAMVVSNLVALASLVLFGAMGLAIFHVATA